MLITKINISGIVNDHLGTLVHEHSGKRSAPDYVLFYGVPLIVAFAMVWFKGFFGKTIGGVLITSLSVFAALLLNLLLLIYDIVRKADQSPSAEKKRQFLKQIYSNISYSILVAVATIILLLGYFVTLAFSRLEPRYVLAYLIYSLSTNFILTILMVLKRVHNMLSTEFDGFGHNPHPKPSRNTKTT